MLDDVPLAPLDRGEALELRGAAVLREARGVPGVDLDALADVVVAAGNLLLACPAVTALDVNSVLATADGAVAVDWKFSIDRRSEKSWTSAEPTGGPGPQRWLTGCPV